MRNRFTMAVLAIAGSWLVCASVARAQTEVEARPRIGLVLSGGGARGAAHVGVLQVLEELRVPVDFVVGTSMGAIAGGLYSSGYSAAELEEILTSVDWNFLLSDRPSRRVLPFRRREDDRAFRLRGSLKLDGAKVRIPSGAVEGRNIVVFFRSLTLPVATIESFDDLPLPYRAVTTDIRTGERVVIDSGDLAIAMRASMSVPGVFSPVVRGENLLVDGGVSDNLPIGVAKGLEPDVIIAVDVGDTMVPLTKDSSVLAVFNQMLTALISRESKREAETLGDRDVLIVPDLEGIGSGDFGKLEEGIQAGVVAAASLADDLRALSLTETDYAAYRGRIEPPSKEPPVVGEIRITTGGSVDPDLIRDRLATEKGEDLDMEVLAADLDRLSGLDFFEAVDFGIEEASGHEIVLRIDAKPRSRGLSIMRFHIELFDDLEGGTAFGLGLRLTSPQLGRHGLELRTDVLLGDQQRFGGELYQPFPGGLFIAPRIAYQEVDQSLFLDGVELAQYRKEGWSGGFDLGLRLGHWGELRAGYSLWRVLAQRQVGASGPPSPEFDEREARLLLRVDSMDHASFARRGIYLEAKASRLLEGFAGKTTADLAEIRYTQAFSRNRFRSALHLEGGMLFDDEAEYLPFELGGFLRLSGLRRMELIGRHQALVSARVLWELGGASLNMPFFVGLSLEAGNVWLVRSDIALDDLLWHGSLFLALDSYLGPVYLGMGYGEGQRRKFYFGLGRQF